VAYSKVRIYNTSPGDLVSREIDISLGNFSKTTFTGMVLREQLPMLQQAFSNMEVLAPNYPEKPDNEKNNFWISSSNCRLPNINYAVPQQFQLGSMGGFYTLDEAMAELDTMAMLYPNLITPKMIIDSSRTTIEGRPVYYLKISDNPHLDENEPEILFTSLHHSQEPMSLQQQIFFMYYLLENYGTNEEITYLVDNTEIYFVPAVNPDGYVYNQQENPGGGGLWRKNRRDNGFFSYGVDLNRNYGYMWGYDNIGSQPIGSSPWYRGTAAFSEPESQIMRSLLNAREFKIAINWHSFGNYIIYPWNYKNIYTPDSAVFFSCARTMAGGNRYLYGTVAETYGYQSNGDADDWAYGEQSTKGKILSLTAEVGNTSDDFWPAPARIIPLAQEALDMNLKAVHLMLQYARINNKAPYLLSQPQIYVPFELECIGLDTPSTFTVSIQPLLNVAGAGNDIVFSAMNLLEKREDSIQVFLSAGLAQGSPVSYILHVNNGKFVFSDTVNHVFGIIEEFLYDDCSTLQHWSGDWNITTEKAFSGQHSLTDSPNANYSVYTSYKANLKDTIDLSAAHAAAAEFYAQWDIERGFDYLKVEVSTDYGNSWIPLCGRYSAFGSDDLSGPDPVYDGRMNDWVREEIILDDFIGQQIMMRLRLETDQSNSSYDGFYMDDFRVNVIRMATEIAGKNSITDWIIEQRIDDVAGKIFWTFNESCRGSLLLSDLSGKTISNFSWNGNTAELPIAQLPAGCYIVRIQSDNRPERQMKFIK
jgi:carboxypeptidase T